MVLTKEQLSELICKHSERENGLQDLLEILLESMMVSERREYLRENSASGNKCNGFRPGHSYGHGRTLTFRIPRDRYGNFHPRILAILRHQEDECERLAGTLYTKGLTQEQVGEVFQDIYGEHYSKASISRMLDYLREDVSQWLTRSLEAYYPIVFIDCVHMKIHRRRSVETEALWYLPCVKTSGARCWGSSTNPRRAPWLGRDARRAAGTRRSEDRPGVCRWAEGSGGCHQCGLSRDATATLYDASETQSAELRAQRRQGRAGRGSATALPYGRP